MTCLGSIYSELCGKIQELFPEKFVDCVYHYTSLPVLWELLRPTASFNCTFFRELSDTEEFKTGLFAIFRGMKRQLGGEEIRMLKTMYDMSGDDGLNCLPWIMSFSASYDETKMWQEYTDASRGGCAIGFDCTKLQAAVQSKVMMNHQRLSWFLPCIYLGENDKKLEELTLFTFEYLSNKLASAIGSDIVAERIARALMCFTLSSIIKHADFRHEKEWRLIVQPIELQTVADAVNIVGGKLRIRARQQSENMSVSESIVRIIVSPHGDSEKLMRMVRAYLAVRGLKSKLIVISGSPYRGAKVRSFTRG